MIREDGKRVGLKGMQEISKALMMPTVPVEKVDLDFSAKYPTVEALLDCAAGN